MKKYIILLVLILLVLSVLSFASVAKTNKQIDDKNFVSDEIIIKLKENVDINSLDFNDDIKGYKKIVHKIDKYAKKYGLDRLYVLKINDKKYKEILEFLEHHQGVEYAEPNYIFYTALIPNDPDFSKLYGLHNTGQTNGTQDADIDAPEAWNIQTGSNSVIIAVIDTGIDYNHEDLSANMWTNSGEIPNNRIDDDGNGFVDDYRGWDFYNNDNNPFDDHGHGTHVAGTIGAVGNNGIGIVGVNWNVKILPVKFLSAGGSGTTAGAVSSVNYATLIGVHIMSNSWGGGGYSQALKDAIQAANDAGILFVAAAGNSNSNNDLYPNYPSNYDVPNVVAVAATDHNDNKASFSSYGATTVDLGAPGVNIYSTVPAGSCSLCNPTGYTTLSGTSMATPHVSGVAGLIRAQFPELTSDGIKARLLNGVDPIEALNGITITGGRLNAYNTFEEDSIPPSAVTDLLAGSPTFSSITLTWTATGDDGSIGTANAYDIRYSTSPIDETNWNNATKANGEPKPQPSGSIETFKVTGLTESTTYYFAMKVIDNLGNPSGLSNIASGTTTTPAIIFKDDMESGVNGWTHSGTGDNWELGTPTSGPGYAYSGLNVWATNVDGNYGIDYMDARLVSPSISLNGVESAQLVFQHYFYTENYYDGGIVEISTNGGISWTQIYPIGGYPEDALYYDNPLGSVPAYSGYSGAGWHQAVFDISSYDGFSNIKIGFRFGTDYSVNSYPGWYIDDVVIFGDLAEPNNPPVANANGPYTGIENQPVIFDGSGSYDLDNDTITYSWNFGDNLTGTGMNPTHTYTAGGLYTVTLTVRDGKVNSAPSTTTATITEVNDPPFANAGPDKSGVIAEVLTFDGSGSYDEEGIASYHWNFGDGSTAIGQVVTHSYSSAGTFTVTLTVTDNGGLTAQDTAIASITDADIVTITKAEYNGGKKELSVEATSTKGGEAVLTVVGFGTMQYNTRKNIYQFTKTMASSPGTVTVVSSLGGTDTKNVVVKGKK